MWTKLVRRVCPYDTDDGESGEEFVANHRSKVMLLVEILKMTEDPNPLLLDLLHIVCKRFPSVGGEDLRQDMRGFVRVSCSCEEISHTVSPFGFLLLEAVEGVMGTTEQKAEKVVVPNLPDLELAALESRLFRQQDLIDPWGTPVGQDTKVEVLSLACNSKESAEAISTLLQYCQSVDVQHALINIVDLGIEGWAALGKALSPNFVNWIFSNQESLASARREDLRVIWEKARHGWGVLQGEDVSDMFDEWHEFERFLDGEDDVNENEGEDGDEDNDA